MDRPQSPETERQPATRAAAHAEELRPAAGDWNRDRQRLRAPDEDDEIDHVALRTWN